MTLDGVSEDKRADRKSAIVLSTRTHLKETRTLLAVAYKPNVSARVRVY